MLVADLIVVLNVHDPHNERRDFVYDAKTTDSSIENIILIADGRQ